MSDLNSQQKSYLEELYRMTGGDPTVQASMHDVGAVIGLDRGAAGKLAEELIAQGHVEIRTLSGGIGITQLGIESANTGAETTGSAGWRLGGTTILDEKDRTAVEAALDAIRLRYDLVGAHYILGRALSGMGLQKEASHAFAAGERLRSRISTL